jgi:alpha-L-arabinofuranosidase
MWGYHTSGAFGVHEFLQWCEDLEAEPLYVINVGMGHGYAVPMKEMKEWVQDALDLVEYARGPVTSRWGSKRAAAGHPRPFKFRYIEIGNENGGPEYDERYALFYDVLKKKYPDLHLIANFWSGSMPQSRPVEIRDEHFYLDTDSFQAMTDLYKANDRNGWKVYVGEYAVTQGCGLGNLKAALGEAAFMTGLEANADAVVMASYAPLFVHPAWKAWNPNAIVFDQSQSYGTPSYHVQALFAANRADEVCPIDLDQPERPYTPPHGRFGVGAWATEVEFKDITFTGLDGKKIFKSDISKGMAGWKAVKGDWKVVNGVLRQTGKENQFSVAEIEGSDWGDGVYALKARKIEGADGFQIQFQAETEGQQRVWNVGGWGNSVIAFQGVLGEPKIPGKAEADRWYDVRIELSGRHVRCYLDGKLTQEVERGAPKRLYAVAGRAGGGREIILKVVNTSDEPMTTTFDLKGWKKVGPTATEIEMTSGSLDDENSFESPHKVSPVEKAITGLSSLFERTIPARSVVILRLPVTP